MLPTFVVIGAQKAGTTALYAHLAAHPGIHMSGLKEPHFFAWEGREFDLAGPRAEDAAWQIVNDLASYEALFDGARPDQPRGEASSGYLQAPHAAARMRDHVPDLRLVAILREPVSRAHSAFLHARRQGVEPLPRFEDALAAEPARVEQDWTGMVRYVTTGCYATALQPYLDAFPPGQLRVYLNDDLARDPGGVLADLYAFVGADPGFRPDVAERHNVGRAVRSPALDLLVRRTGLADLARTAVPERFARRVYGLLNEKRPDPVSDAARAWILERVGPEIEAMSGLIDRDLTPWVRGERVPPPADGQLGRTPR